MKKIINIAIVAHVDHGKTTLVDELLKQSGTFSEREVIDERVMDSNDLERERGITILSKNTSIEYQGIKINIVDTPGHADFGGEVERVLSMVDGILLLVDAFEGPMPQTRFVLSKALQAKLKPIVVINKIDRPGSTPHSSIDKVLDLFIELEADDEQLEFPVVYTSAKKGVATLNLEDEAQDMKPLFETIISTITGIEQNDQAPLQILISNIEGNEYLGTLALGRIHQGVPKRNQAVLVGTEDETRSAKISKLFTYEGLEKVEIEEGIPGDIVAVAGLGEINIGDTIGEVDNFIPIPFTNIDSPTVSMTFSVNNGPFAGLEGDYVTSRHLKERLEKETETNLSLRVEETDSKDSFKVSGRGELHLSILIETMRREGYEFMVSKPTIILREIKGVIQEPVEDLVIDVPEEFMGVVMEKLGMRKAELKNMLTGQKGYTRLEFKIPSRNLIGYSSEFLTDTKGNGILNHTFACYMPAKEEIVTRNKGVLVAFEDGTSTDYGLFNAQDRGTLFIGSGIKIYEGMIVGENNRGEDININVCKQKHLTNMRSSSADEALRLNPPRTLSLEQSLEFIGDDELVEVTPSSVRLRKRILNNGLRAKSLNKKRY
ncbi:MAG: translational GTPase TypA [Fusobacteria bacterium]|nr:translational GTPase TypA [Fusobacteriota bacterium]